MKASFVLAGVLSWAILSCSAQNLGLFESEGDVGADLKPGSTAFDPSSGDYRITGGGANIWASTDAFHFVWKKLSGDMAITADVRFEGAGAVAHRKAVLMFRQNLDPGSPYADIAIHGDGLNSLQFRTLAGGLTLELRSKLKGPIRLRIERRGANFMAYAGNPGEELKPLGPALVAMSDPLYVGLGVCAHDAGLLETVVFSNVKIEPLPPQTPSAKRARVRSKITIFTLKDKTSKVIYTADKTVEAPNWSRDGRFLLFNSGGSLFKFPVNTPGAEPGKINLGVITGCNNDHGIAPDGKKIAFSATTAGATGSEVYLAGADGSNARLMTVESPSYYHGWSPDGKWLAFVGQRNRNFDIFRVSTGGGEEQRLTMSPGYDDGPDYSPDGKWIYINSDRTGQFQIWRIPASGAGPDDQKAERVLSDGTQDWFPHPSPNGKWIVFISFKKGTKGHPANQEVQLQLMPLPGAKVKPPKVETLANVFGGQGTMNVNSWSPDSTQFAYVTYELLDTAKAN